MAPTEYPINYVYAGAAQPLTLSTGISDTGGDLNIEVSEDAAMEGWPTLGANEFIVVVVGRGTAYESKYLVKSISAQQGGGTLLVVDADDKTYDGTAVTAAPIGSLVEHCLSATEMSLANDHMRTKQAHGSDGDLVDQNSTQTLTNKTLTSPVITGLATWTTYTPTLTASVTSPTGWTQTGRYTQIDKLVVAKFEVTAGGGMTAGEGSYQIALPVTAKTTLTNANAGTCLVLDDNTGYVTVAEAYTPSSSYVQLRYVSALPTGTLDVVGHNKPISFAASDMISGTLIYEVA